MENLPIPAEEVARIFDTLHDVVFFIKDYKGDYICVNRTLMYRLGVRRREDAMGKSPKSLFLYPFSAGYQDMDVEVLNGRIIENHLELHIFPDHVPSWCLTSRYPLRKEGEPAGMIGISRDLAPPVQENSPVYDCLRPVVQYMEDNYTSNVRVDVLAGLARTSTKQLERHFRSVFKISLRQMITKLRVEAAVRLLCQPKSIVQVALECGYSDQSAFNKVFRELTGLTPSQYREWKS